MALTVGTDSYISVSDADIYWSNRNNTTWSAASTAEKEAALREATQLLDGMFTWIGTSRGDPNQVRAWPRDNAIIREPNFEDIELTGIPQQVKDATCEMALVALSARLIPVNERGGAIKRERVEGAVTVEYMDHAPEHKSFDFVRFILRGLIHNRGAIRLQRV